jgi:putative nucleotidyltransferase with HDIG domain
LVDGYLDMFRKPSLDDQEQLADTFRRASLGMTMRERVAEILVGCGFAAVTALLWWMRPPHAFALIPVALCVVVLVVAARVRFDMPFGFTVPTQLAFVPLLFATPLAIVPIAVVASLTIARLPDLRAGKIRASRLLQTVGNSWFAIGPVAVFVVASTEPGDAGPALLVAALAAQFVIDFTVSALRISIGRGASFSPQLRETRVYAIDAALSGVALAVAEGVHTYPALILAPLPILVLLAVFANERHQAINNLIELSGAYRGTALVLSKVVEADDDYTGKHSKGVVELALALGAALDLDAEHLRNLEFAALLHDVGKIAIPKEIINKPGTLDAHERKLIETHTREGQKMLDTIGGFMGSVGLIVRSHHERWDGAGYPDGFAGEDIPLEARIIACCDSWNAMRTDRPYVDALSLEVARAELTDNAGRQFDPTIVEAFLQLSEDTVERTTATFTTTATLAAPTARLPRQHTGKTIARLPVP